MQCERATHYYKYAVHLDTNAYCDISSAEILLAQNRRFTLYHWNEDAHRVGEFGEFDRNSSSIEVKNIYITSGRWEGLAGCSQTLRWKKWRNEKRQLLSTLDSGGITPMHMHFRNREELKEWLGNLLYVELFAELV